MVASTSYTFVAALVVSSVSGHGALMFPKSRNVLHTFNVHTGANGPSVCGSGTGTQWPANDEDASAFNGPLMTPLTELVAGGKVDVEFAFTAAHQGHAVLELCSNPVGNVLTDDCFQRLQRDPTDERMSPFLPEAPTHFFMPANECIPVDGARTLKARYIIPSGTVSEHAVLRFFWQTGNSCESSPHSFRPTAPAKFSEWTFSYNGRTCSVPLTYMGKPCGTDCPNAHCTDESFRNCADVKIVSGDASIVITRPEGEGVGEGSGEEAGEGHTEAAPIGDGLEDCLLRIKGTASHFDEHCQQACRDYAEAGSSQQAWCLASGQTNLKTCVATAQAACV